MDLSVVVPFVHEYPSLIHTVFSIQNELSDENYSYEIIVVENIEKDPYTPKFLHYMRNLVSMKRLSYYWEPRPCGPIARNTGARHAEGKYLLFMDAHTELGKNTLPLLINLMEEKDAGMVHGCTVYSHWDPQNAGCHYKQFGGGGPALYSHMHGTYQRCRSAPEPYPVAGGTLAYVLFNLEEFWKLRGYNENCRYYPHPEGYLPLKYWMCGRECWLHPKAYHYHTLYKRNYGAPPKTEVMLEGKPHRLTWNDNLIRNTMICGYALGDKEWVDKIYAEWIKRGAKPEILTAIMNDALEKGQDDRDWIANNAKYKLKEILEILHKRGVKGVEELPWLQP